MSQQTNRPVTTPDFLKQQKKAVQLFEEFWLVCTESWTAQSVQWIGLGLRTKESCFDYWHGQKIYRLRNVQTGSVVHQVFCATITGIWPGHEVDYTSPNAKAKIKWSCPSI